MKRNTIMKVVTQAISDRYGINNVSEDDRFDSDLALDSLDKLDLIMDLEKTFGVCLRDEYVEGIFTVNDLVESLDKIINEK